MSATTTRILGVIGGILVERNGMRMVLPIHDAEITLEAHLHEEPDLDLGFATLYGNTIFDYYDVTLTAKADRLTIWDGTWPGRSAIDNPSKEITP